MLKRSFCVFLCALIALLCINVSGNPAPAAEQKATVTGSNVRIRASHSTSSQILKEVSYVEVTVNDTVNTGEAYPWYNVTYDGITGYIYGRYIRLIENTDPDNTVPAPEPDPTPDFEAQLSTFPESYRPYLTELHSEYPNWVFSADKLSMSYDTAVKNEDIYPRKLVNLSSDSISWRSMGKNSYSWTTGAWSNTEGGWTGASTEVIKYYMDPRNFLNKNDIYMFLQQSYDDSQTVEGIDLIIKGTFLASGYSDPDDTAFGGSYSRVILEAAKQSGVSAYVLASTIILEQGKNGTSSIISGTTSHGKFFNFFNIKATGSSDAEILASALAYAKDQGWSTRSAAIIGGAKFYAAGYIKNGQDTYFYKNFDLLDSPYYTHQYAQSIYDSHSSARLIRSSYIQNREAPLVFRIPVYSSIPNETAPKPPENSKKNNYYLLSADIDGFSMYKYEYSFSVTGDKTIRVTIPSGASLISGKTNVLAAGLNNITVTVKSESGYTRDYKLAVTAPSPCTLTVTDEDITEPPDDEDTPPVLPEPPNDNTGTETPPAGQIGDINSDGLIDGVDLAAIKLHILKIRELNNDMMILADIDKSGNIDGVDLAAVKLHILKIRLIY